MVKWDEMEGGGLGRICLILFVKSTKEILKPDTETEKKKHFNYYSL